MPLAERSSTRAADLWEGCSRGETARGTGMYHVWVLAFECEHGSDQNLLDPVVGSENFVGVGAAPECLNAAASAELFISWRGVLWGPVGFEKDQREDAEEG